MKFTAHYLAQAEKLLTDLFMAEKPKLLAAAHGKIEHSIKDDETVVTELDKQMEAAIREALLKFDPAAGIEGEELGQTGSRDTYWLLDPIDGTESFIRGLTSPRNMATLVDNNEAVFTIIYKFVTDELFIATKGRGAFKNGQPIHVSDRPLKRTWIDYGTRLADPKLLSKFLAIRPHVNGYVIMHDFLEIATGALDAGIWDSGDGGPWDYAPRGLIFQEAGATVINAGASNFNFKEQTIIVAGPQIFDELNKLYNEN